MDEQAGAPGGSTPAVLETPRLRLREMALSDLDFVAEMLGHPDVSHFYERRFTRAAAEDWLRRQMDRYRADGHGLWLVLARESGGPVGQVGLALQEVEGRTLPEIGWLLHRDHWGQGYATEAAAATRDAAFERWGYSRVISLIRPENERSARVARRIGMVAGGTVRFHGFVTTVFSLERRHAAV